MVTPLKISYNRVALEVFLMYFFGFLTLIFYGNASAILVGLLFFLWVSFVVFGGKKFYGEKLDYHPSINPWLDNVQVYGTIIMIVLWVFYAGNFLSKDYNFIEYFGEEGEVSSRVIMHFVFGIFLALYSLKKFLFFSGDKQEKLNVWFFIALVLIILPFFHYEATNIISEIRIVELGFVFVKFTIIGLTVLSFSSFVYKRISKKNTILSFSKKM